MALEDAIMRKQQLWKGMVAGGAAGLAGAIAMTQFQNLWSKASHKLKESKGSQTASSEQKSEDATMKAAEKAAELAGHELSRDQKKKAAPLVHYGFATAMGALYGAITEFSPRQVRRHDLLSGMGFGSILFAGADEIAVPILGLSGSPAKAPVSSHIYALASHLVYGATTGTVRKLVRAAI
jgi:putative membrane protein